MTKAAQNDPRCCVCMYMYATCRTNLHANHQFSGARDRWYTGDLAALDVQQETVDNKD